LRWRKFFRNNFEKLGAFKVECSKFFALNLEEELMSMGYLPPKAIYATTVALTSSTEKVLFPLQLVIKRNSVQSAIAEAKSMIEAAGAEVDRYLLSGSQLQVLELNDTSDKAFLTITPESKNTIQLQIDFFVELSIEQSCEFWQQIEIIAKCLDFLGEMPKTITRKETSLSLGKALIPGEETDFCPSCL
jgi:hypothetical protein